MTRLNTGTMIFDFDVDDRECLCQYLYLRSEASKIDLAMFAQ